MPPIINLNDWFLSDRNNPDTLVSPSTATNQVEVLIDGASYMGKLKDMLTAAGPGDFFYYAGWELNLDVKMVSLDANSTVRKVFTAASKNKVDIRVLLSNHIHLDGVSPNLVAAWEFGQLNPRIECVLDSRFQDFGSAHQKFSVLFTKNQLHAFCGGIDLQLDRLDDGTHSLANRQYKDFPGGWHDVHTHIQGPACVDLALMFQERWNNPALPARLEYFPFTRITQPVPASATPPAGDHFVQLLRTYSCRYTDEVLLDAIYVDYPFARNGEFSARDACLKAISNAQDFVYIEDQYFFSYEIAAALRDRMIQLKKQEDKDLLVIVLVPLAPTADPKPAWENYYQAQTLQGLIGDLKQEQLGLEANFAIYDLYNAAIGEPIYVHAKLMIVDDIWVEIGSMNCNRRSTTHDYEAAIAVVDGDLDAVPYPNSYGQQVCKFARNLRLRLWSEHLGAPYSSPLIDDPEVGFQTWSEVAANQSAQVRAHAPAPDQESAPWLWGLIADPQGTCLGSPPIPDPWPGK